MRRFPNIVASDSQPPSARRGIFLGRAPLIQPMGRARGRTDVALELGENIFSNQVSQALVDDWLISAVVRRILVEYMNQPGD